MDEYIPPFVAVTTGILVVCLCFFMRVPFFLVGILAFCLIFYAIQDHLMRFTLDYQHFSVPNFLKENASILIIGIVILLSLGYLLLTFGAKTVVTNQPTNIGYGSAPSKSGWFNWMPNFFKRKQNQIPPPQSRYFNNSRYLSDPLSLIRRT